MLFSRRCSRNETEQYPPHARSGKALQAEQPDSALAVFGADEPLRLDSGAVLSPFQLTCQIYGVLNAGKSKAILICHPLTCNQHVANTHPITGKPGW